MSSSTFCLHNENLVPFYLVEDRLKDNFNSIAQQINSQLVINNTTSDKITEIKTKHSSFQQEMSKKLVELEKKIVAEIGQELEGRIIVAINKNMASFASRMEQKEKQISDISQGINTKLDKLKQQLLTQNVKDTQKQITKEIQKSEKKMKNSIEEIIRKTGTTANLSLKRPPSPQKEFSLRNTDPIVSQSHESHFTEEWVLRIKQLEAKTSKTEQFLVGFDKRFYESMSSLKESWKQMGEDVLNTKKKLTTKQDELRLQLIRIKGIKQFQGSPEDYEQTFKTKLLNKFTDMYQMLTNLISRTDFESEVDKLKRITYRHDSQLSDVRQQMSKNSEYFTFYINNSNTDDLCQQIKLIREDTNVVLAATKQDLKVQNQKQAQLKQEITSINQLLEIYGNKYGQSENRISNLREQLFKQIERIDALEEHNNFTPQKLAKIHNTLDHGFSPDEQELITKKSTTLTQNLALKQLRAELSKVKDEVFVLAHQLAEVEKVKKSMTGLEGKIDKMKVESQQAILTRKPWVCLSCDRNEKQLQNQQDKIKRDSSKKKLVDPKALFSKEKSDKLIKLIPTGEQKFEIYEKYREKYMSESIRLPEIYKQKIGEKQPPLG